MALLATKLCRWYTICKQDANNFKSFIYELLRIYYKKWGLIMTKGEIAKNNFLKGYNCSQSVLLAFCKDFGIDEKTALMLSSPFGGGMGRLREVCGAVSGMFMVLGLARGYIDTDTKEDKSRLYAEVQKLAEEFKKANSSIICRELLQLRSTGKDNPVPSDRTEQYYKARPCKELCEFSANLLERFLSEVEAG